MAEPGNVTWSECSGAVVDAYDTADFAQSMAPLYADLIARAPALRLLVYSGDDDSVCATLGTQQWIWGLGLPTVAPWAPWTDGASGQVGGFLARLDGLDFATVHGAGHMCPATQPARTFQLLASFLNGTIGG